MSHLQRVAFISSIQDLLDVGGVQVLQSCLSNSGFPFLGKLVLAHLHKTQKIILFLNTHHGQPWYSSTKIQVWYRRLSTVFARPIRLNRSSHRPTMNPKTISSIFNTSL